MRITIGIKIFGIAVGLLIPLTVVALLSMRMTRTVDDQLVIIDRNYFPAYVALAQANIRSIEESAYVRRLLLAITEPPDNGPKLNDLRQRIANAAKQAMNRSPLQAGTSTSTLSEGMTPAALVTVLNRYLTLMSEPVRRNNGIIDIHR
jgi:hypothetical protein